MTAGTFADLLDLEKIEHNLYRAHFVFSDTYTLYGGQVAAQALRAAGLTVEPDRRPHSLHGYFLRPGDASRPTVFQVFRDRDGRSFSARRVVALQGGEVIFNMSASFHVPEDGHEGQKPLMPDVPAPDLSPPHPLHRLYSFESREAPQPYGDVVEWPMRFWARCTISLGDDPLLNACAVTYLSDASTGLSHFHNAEFISSSSLDHAVWFHRPVPAEEWMLVDLSPRSTSAGRGWYTGSLFDVHGILLASIAQETLFRRRRSAP